MRVLQVSKFYPPVMGGIEAVAWELTEGLNRSGVRTDVLCSGHRWRGRQERMDAGYEVCRAGCWAMALSTSISPGLPWHLSRMARGVDIVHVHMPDPMAAAAYCVTRPHAKLVVHWHSDVIRQRFALKVYEPLQRWLLARADAIIATSPPYAASSEPLQPWRDKVVVVPIGISDNRNSVSRVHAAVLRQRFRGRRLIFALGRMTYYKGFDILINAAAALPDDCAVLIGGDGELLEHYKSMVTKRGLVGKVHLLGHIADHELASHFEACDIFCMSSTVRSEAYGVAILEAMVMGKPIVATDIEGSGVPWVNEHGVTGLNVPAGNVPQLVEALQFLLRDDARRAQYGKAARARFERDFKAERMTRLTLRLYGRLLQACAINRNT